MRQSLTVSAIVYACLCLSTPATAATFEAQICDDINAISNGWTAIANALEETAGDDIGDLDVARLEDDVNTLLDPTEQLGAALVEYGNADEELLGEDLLDITGEFYDIDGDDLAAYLVDVIDDLVDTLDDVVDYCDASNN